MRIEEMPDAGFSTLILGGARSGKSHRALVLAEDACAQRTYIATAQSLDDEMGDRIARHQAERGDDWQTIEEPFALSSMIKQTCMEERSVLVDCLTLWLSNIMLADMDVDAEVQLLAETIRGANAPLILVSNEVGMGIVPASSLGRRFRDEQGRLNQMMATICTRVEMVTAGLVTRLKG